MSEPVLGTVLIGLMFLLMAMGTEVALALGIARTASVRAVTPAVVASCDQETFDELLRPLFADD